MRCDRDAALTLGKAASGLNAQTKGRMLAIFGEALPAVREAMGELSLRLIQSLAKRKGWRGGTTSARA